MSKERARLDMANSANELIITALRERIVELEQGRKDLIEEFAEAVCMGDLASIARSYGYEEGRD